jgi:hypothetical protein
MAVVVKASANLFIIMILQLFIDSSFIPSGVTVHKIQALPKGMSGPHSDHACGVRQRINDLPS